MSTAATQPEPGSPAGAAVIEQRASPEVFPLAATPFERYLATDERAGYPMSFRSEARVDGEIEPQRLNDAIGVAWYANPLLQARLAGSEWQSGDGVPPRLSETPYGVPIDLVHENPLRLSWRPDGPESILAIDVHHAACDGIGAIRFLGDVVAAYNGSGPGLLDSASAEALRQRGRIDRTGLPPVGWWQAHRFLAGELWRFATARPSMIVSRKIEHAPARMRTIRFDRALVAALSRSLRPSGSSLNTGLLASAFATAARSDCLRLRGSLIRITTPFSLRGAADRDLSASNKIGYAFLDRTLAQTRDAAKLLPGLQQEIDAIQKWKLAAGFIDALGNVGSIPGGLWAATRLSGCLSTLVLSNVGDPRRRCRARQTGSDGLNVVSVRGAPPVRPGTSLSLGVSAYAGGLLITAARDPARLSEADTDGLLTSLETTCRDLAGLPAEPGEVVDGFPE